MRVAVRIAAASCHRRHQLVSPPPRNGRPSASAPTPPIRPSNSIDSSGKIVGFDIEILNAICDELKVTCEYINQDFDGIIPALIAGKFDVIDLVDLDHRGTQEDDRLHRQVSTIRRPRSRPQGCRHQRHRRRRPRRQDNRRAVVDHPRELLAEDLYQVRRQALPEPDQYKLDLISGRLDAVNDDVVVLEDWLKRRGR